MAGLLDYLPGLLGRMGLVPDAGMNFGTATPQEMPYTDAALTRGVEGTAHALLDPMKNAVQEGQNLSQGGEYNPGNVLPAAMMATGGSYALAPKEANAVGMGIRAYHGSPHDFDRFDLSKIGTGEGAQAYGHGLYFAENPQVAQQYKDGVLNMPLIRGNNAQMADLAKTMEQYAIPGKYRQFTDPAGHAAAAEYDRLMEQKMAPGKMYEVNINAEPQQFLDWDRPLLPQMPADVMPVLDAASHQFYKRPLDSINDTAQSFLVKNALKNPNSTAALAERGIPGIKYLDQGSRVGHAESETSNYVVFNDKLIDILKKYGLAGLGLPMLAGAQDQQTQ
jgi:hypothetical protein